MPRYYIGPESKIRVKARSSVHDTVTEWSKISGHIAADSATLADVGASATATVDMTVFDAGDFLKNRKVRKDFELEAHPAATFTLHSVGHVVQQGDHFRATAVGTLTWRGHSIEVVIEGRGALTALTLEAQGSFALDIRRLGLQAPKILMFKVQDEVTVDIVLRGNVEL
jgi:polyisoprenoid-binding protein YceI